MTAEELLDWVQDLVGEPIGGFYNISRRLALLSQAQNELVAETKAIQCTAVVPIVAGEPVIVLPSDFGQFGSIPPTIGDSILEVVSPLELNLSKPDWVTTNEVGTPTKLVARGSDWLLVPTPDTNGELILTYVPVLADLEHMDDISFRGYPNLERFSPGIAYRVAAIIMLSRNPTLAGAYNDLYIQEERKMRHATRSNSQKGQRVFPAAGRGYYATRS